MGKKVTIKYIAQLANVSIGTVDRVIHNRGEVSGKTKEKILEIISKLKFKPDVLASTLASKKSVKFAVLMPAADTESSFWRMPCTGLDKAFNEIAHYGVTECRYLFSLSDKSTFLKEAHKAISGKPDALLIAPSFHKEAKEIAEICSEKKIRVAFFNSSVANSNHICFVGQNASQSGRVAARLMDYGIAPDSGILIVSIFSFLKNSSHILSRKNGFIKYFKEHNNQNAKLISLDIDSLKVKDLNKELRSAFSENPSIRGIFVTNSRVFNVASFIESEKLSNINLIGYDLTAENIPYLEKNIIKFLISQKPVEQGYRAIMTMFNSIVLKKEVPKDILLPIEIVIKENLRYYEEY